MTIWNLLVKSLMSKIGTLIIKIDLISITNKTEIDNTIIKGRQILK